jgi:hypothetical protein
MKDFTLAAYKKYLGVIKSSYANVMRFIDYFSLSKSEVPASFIIIRHDVDRKPGNALKMAMLENEMEICSTYFFRTKPHTFKPEIIRAIADKDHEIGYHYETLSDANGDFALALSDFEVNLYRLREVVPIKTIAMHGSPLKPYDNRDLWKKPENHDYLKNRLNILGEVYLDIDYQEIAYINDTGRNWHSEKSNNRDMVISAIKPNIKNAQKLLECLKTAEYRKVVFQIHPERWSDSFIQYYIQSSKDHLANFIKLIVR